MGYEIIAWTIGDYLRNLLSPKIFIIRRNSSNVRPNIVTDVGSQASLEKLRMILCCGDGNSLLRGISMDQFCPTYCEVSRYFKDLRHMRYRPPNQSERKAAYES